MILGALKRHESSLFISNTFGLARLHYLTKIEQTVTRISKKGRISL